MSALNGTYEKKGWENILRLIPLCEKVKSLSAICKICSANANYTFRTVAGSSQELIGGADMYMPLCRECYQYKSSQMNQKYDEPASADEKNALLSSTSTAFNDSGSEKNNSFDAHNKQQSDRLIDMN